MRKKLIAIDFDGVLYSFSSGWVGTDQLPDLPVKGAIKWLLKLVGIMRYDIVIYSCRNESRRGRKAMKKWLVKHGFPKEFLRLLSFPKTKPAGLLIDDRCIQFRPEWGFPTLSEIDNFVPWHGKGVWDDETV